MDLTREPWESPSEYAPAKGKTGKYPKTDRDVDPYEEAIRPMK